MLWPCCDTETHLPCDNLRQQAHRGHLDERAESPMFMRSKRMLAQVYRISSLASTPSAGTIQRPSLPGVK